jgi:hypothetical protein
MNPCKLSARYLLLIRILCDYDKDENTILVVRLKSASCDAIVPISLALKNAMSSHDALRALLSCSSSCGGLSENKECEYDQPSESADLTRVRLVI